MRKPSPATRRPSAPLLPVRTAVIVTVGVTLLLLWMALRTVYNTGKALSSPDALWALSQRSRNVPALPADESVSVTLERTGCNGTCPAYVVTLYGSGRVHFEGTQFVCHVGEAEGKADPVAVARLVAGLDRVDFARMPDYLARDKTDMPMAMLSLARGNAVHRVQHSHGDQSAPPVLMKIEDRIDAVAGTARWIQGGADGASADCGASDASQGRS